MDIETIRAMLIAGGHVRGPQATERARLYAAAPAMLAALKRIALDADALNWAEIRAIAQDAIRDTEGR